MLLEPHNKVNHIAMLNTLFPPVSDATPTPTPQLTHQILRSQRDGFFRYINAVDSHGSDVLLPVIAQGAPEGHINSWPLVYVALDKYLSLVNVVIDECILINEPAHLESASPYRHKNRKADSGISFGSSSTDVSVAEGIMDKPLPQFPAPAPVTKAKAQSSALERLMTEIRRLGPSGRSKNLKKMKSTTALASPRPGSQHSYAESSFFEIDEQKRRRLIGEATIRKTSQPSVPSFHAH